MGARSESGSTSGTWGASVTGVASGTAGPSTSASGAGLASAGEATSFALARSRVPATASVGVMPPLPACPALPPLPPRPASDRLVEPPLLAAAPSIPTGCSMAPSRARGAEARSLLASKLQVAASAMIRQKPTTSKRVKGRQSAFKTSTSLPCPASRNRRESVPAFPATRPRRCASQRWSRARHWCRSPRISQRLPVLLRDG